MEAMFCSQVLRNTHHGIVPHDVVTGHEIFVGRTSRTNSMGINSLKAAFPNCPVYVIKLSSLKRDATLNTPDRDSSSMAPLHLKSMCSLLHPGRIIVGGPFGLSLQHAMQEALKSPPHHLQTPPPSPLLYTYVPDEGAANCLFINGTIIRRCDWEYPSSAPVFAGLSPLYKQIQVSNSELEKVDGALTCSSVLFE